MSKQDIIHQNAKKYNEDCAAFDMDLQDLENNIPQSAWENVAPNIAQDDRTTNVEGFYTLQNDQQEKEDTIDAVSHDNNRNTRCYLWFPNGNIASIYIWKLTTGGLEWSLYPQQ